MVLILSWFDYFSLRMTFHVTKCTYSSLNSQNIQINSHLFWMNLFMKDLSIFYEGIFRVLTMNEIDILISKQKCSLNVTNFGLCIMNAVLFLKYCFYVNVCSINSFISNRIQWERCNDRINSER